VVYTLLIHWEATLVGIPFCTSLGGYPGGYIPLLYTLGRHPGGYIHLVHPREAPWWVYMPSLYTLVGTLVVYMPSLYIPGRYTPLYTPCTHPAHAPLETLTVCTTCRFDGRINGARPPSEKGSRRGEKEVSYQL